MRQLAFLLTRSLLTGSLSVGSVGISAIGLPAFAQTPTCQPPRADQYLLLVRNQSAETTNQLRQLLPSNAVLNTCDYLGATVVRVESFATSEIANAWSRYLNEMAGLQVFVARPSANAIATTPPQPTTPAVGGTSSAPNSSTPFNPQALGVGYAVLVQYFNRPETATEVRQATSRNVGVAAFEQRPYLLANYTTDATAAAATLKSLTDRGLTAAIVDSRRVTLLSPTVANF